MESIEALVNLFGLIKTHGVEFLLFLFLAGSLWVNYIQFKKSDKLNTNFKNYLSGNIEKQTDVQIASNKIHQETIMYLKDIKSTGKQSYATLIIIDKALGILVHKK